VGPGAWHVLPPRESFAGRLSGDTPCSAGVWLPPLAVGSRGEGALVWTQVRGLSKKTKGKAFRPVLVQSLNSILSGNLRQPETIIWPTPLSLTACLVPASSVDILRGLPQSPFVGGSEGWHVAFCSWHVQGGRGKGRRGRDEEEEEEEGGEDHGQKRKGGQQKDNKAAARGGAETRTGGAGGGARGRGGRGQGIRRVALGRCCQACGRGWRAPGRC